MIILHLFILSALFSPITGLILEYAGDRLGEFFVTGFMCGSRNKPDMLHILSHIQINDTGIEYGFLSYDYWDLVRDKHSTIDRCFLLRKSGILVYKFNTIVPGNYNEYNLTSIIDYQFSNSTDKIKNCYFGVLVDCALNSHNTSKSFSIHSDYRRSNHYQLPAELDNTAKYMPCVTLFFIAFFVILMFLILFNKSVYICTIIILICKYAFEWSIIVCIVKEGRVLFSRIYNILTALADSSIIYMFLILGNNEVQRDLTNKNARFLNRVWPPYIVTTPFFIIISILYFILMTAINYKYYPINNLKPTTLYNDAHNVCYELDLILLVIYVVFFMKSKKSIRFREIHLLVSGMLWLVIYPTGIFLIGSVDPYKWKFDYDMIYISCVIFTLVQLFFYLNPCSNLKLNKIPFQQIPSV